MKYKKFFQVGAFAGLLVLVSTVNAIICDPSYPYRSIDGTCNNLGDALRGSSNTIYARGPEGVQYADGISTPVVRPNGRTISNKIAQANPSERDVIPHSMFSIMFGQFVNHDVDGNRFVSNVNPIINQLILLENPNDPFCVCINSSGLIDNCCLHPHPFLSPASVGTQSSGGAIINGRFEVFNNVTSYLDLSQVYGSNPLVTPFLRTMSAGKLLLRNHTGISDLFRFPYSFSDVLPTYTSTGGNVPVDILDLMPLSQFPSSELFVSGDERVSENTALGMFHLLFTREHNRIASQLAAQNPSWNDEKLFQESRKLNIAQYQNIVFYEFLVNEFGVLPFFQSTGFYTGYDSNLDTTTPISFASAAFRYGHAAITPIFSVNKCGNYTLFGAPTTQPIPNNGVIGGPVSPTDTLMQFSDYESAIRGLIEQKTHSISIAIDDVVRNVVFFAPNGGGTDLLALDMLRARLNGVPNYATIRKAYNNGDFGKIYDTFGCPAWLENSTNVNDNLACFLRITWNQTLAAKLQEIYGKVNNIDAIVGLLAESPRIPTSSFAPTLANMILYHFKALRNGDRFWFENPGQFNWFQVLQIRTTTMSSLLRRNFKNLIVPDNVFVTPENYKNTLANSNICLSG